MQILCKIGRNLQSCCLGKEVMLSCSRGFVYARVELLPVMCHLKLPALNAR